jgi:hypothetical protein
MGDGKGETGGIQHDTAIGIPPGKWSLPVTTRHLKLMKSGRGCRIFIKNTSSQPPKPIFFVILSMACTTIQLGTYFADSRTIT